jgi:hypothetical protein
VTPDEEHRMAPEPEHVHGDASEHAGAGDASTVGGHAHQRRIVARDLGECASNVVAIDDGHPIGVMSEREGSEIGVEPGARIVVGARVPELEAGTELRRDGSGNRERAFREL